jgi:hypothetical protein
MYSINDSKAESFLPPFFMQSDSIARRTFGDCCNDVNHAFCKHPEDYTIFKLGEFDDSTCKVDLLATPFSLGLGTEYVVGGES